MDTNNDVFNLIEGLIIVAVAAYIAWRMWILDKDFRRHASYLLFEMQILEQNDELKHKLKAAYKNRRIWGFLVIIAVIISMIVGTGKLWLAARNLFF